MIDVLVCYSILEKCKSIDAFSSDTEGVPRAMLTETQLEQII